MAFSGVSVLVGMLFGVVAACGGTTKQSPADAAAGASGHGGSATAGDGAVAGAASGGRAVGGTGGRGNVGGAEAGRATEGGAPDTNVAGTGQAGSGDEPDPLACTTPYPGPMAGPRAAGPMLNDTCATISDSVILTRYHDPPARVPNDLYWEPDAPIVVWESPCSASLADTLTRGAAQKLGTLSGQHTTDWFYEAEYCGNGLRKVYRNLRCDYFDDSKLADKDPKNLAFLASILWWQDNSNVDGNAILEYSVSVGNATDWVELCTISTVHGDFGLCDEITVEATTDAVMFDGTVKLGEPKLVRTVKGDCH